MTKTENSSNCAKTEKDVKSADFREMHKSRAIPDSGVPDPRIRLPRPGTPELPSRTQELPCLGGYPPELAWSKGKYAVFCCFLLNSTEFREFPVGGPQKRVFRYPGSKGNFVVSGTPKLAKPGNRPKPGQTGPNRPQTPQFLGSRAPKPSILVPGRGGPISPFLAVTRGGW